MKKHIIGENGIGYTLGEDGLYYPDLRVPDEAEYDIGRFGRLHERYLREYQRWVYLELLTNGRLNGYLYEIDVQCNEMLEFLVEQMREEQGITEELKARDMMEWVGRMNEIRSVAAEEVILKEMVYV